MEIVHLYSYLSFPHRRLDNGIKFFFFVFSLIAGGHLTLKCVKKRSGVMSVNCISSSTESKSEVVWSLDNLGEIT